MAMYVRTKGQLSLCLGLPDQLLGEIDGRVSLLAGLDPLSIEISS